MNPSRPNKVQTPAVVPIETAEHVKSQARRLTSLVQTRPASAGGGPKGLPPARIVSVHEAAKRRRVLKVDGENSAVRLMLEQIALEVKNLQRARLPATPVAIEALLEAIHGLSGDQTFTAKLCLENCQGGEEESVRCADAIQRVIRKPINRVLDTRPSNSAVRSLSRALTRCCGVFGPWQLIQHRAHTNAGNVFRIVKYT